MAQASRKKSKQSTITSTSEEPKIYIGPNLPGQPLAQFQVFRNGIPKFVDTIAERSPEIRGLFIPVGKLAAARKRLAQRGTREQQLFAAVRKAFIQ